MKKAAAAALLTAILALSIGTFSAFAAGPGGDRNFADADGDGICDYAGTVCPYTDENGDGICDLCGLGQKSGAGRNFMDTDGDGVCDNRTAGLCPGQGRKFQGGRNR